MPFRSFDFERIYSEFLNCYESRDEAEREYYSWLKALNLNESKPYGEARESYLWRKEDLQFIREDADAKYYEVEVGFPTRSMNGNVYRKRDLVAAALTLKGKHPSLNHKEDFWFSPKNPRNRWGNIEILEGRFHDGVCKALVRVPKTAICPICNGKPMTELIDNKHIVNVRLEGDCAGGRCYDGTCEGFYFTDPPFTFLTTDVLPGLPMTRIKPLESYLPVSQNSQSSIYRGKINNEKETKILKIKPRIIEETPGNNNSTVNTKSIGTDFRGTFDTPIDSDNKLHSYTTSSDNASTVTGANNEKQMQSGYAAANKQPAAPRNAEAVKEPFAGYTDFDDCVAKNSDKEDPAAYCGQIKSETEALREEQPPGDSWMQPTNKSNDTAQPKPEDITSGPQKSKVPGASDTTIQQKPVPQPEGAPTSFPAITKPEKEEGEEPPKAVDKTVTGNSPAFEQADECADGYHKDADGMCVPDEPLDEQVKRFKAETKEFLAVAESRKMREQMAGIENYWVNKYSKLNEQYIKAAAYSKSQDQISGQLRESVRAEQLRCEDLRVETRDLKINLQMPYH